MGYDPGTKRIINVDLGPIDWATFDAQRAARRRKGTTGFRPRPELRLDPILYAPPVLRLAVLQRDRFLCRYCGSGLTVATANIDHVRAWKRGGRTELTNLVSACTYCNRQKMNRYDVKPLPIGTTQGDAFALPKHYPYRHHRRGAH